MEETTCVRNNKNNGGECDDGKNDARTQSVGSADQDLASAGITAVSMALLMQLEQPEPLMVAEPQAPVV